MNWYLGWKPKPTIETDEGIKAKSKRGDFVKNWWATRWLDSMERLLDRGRLQRGRSYARRGQVLSVSEAKGRITAQVQGSRRRPYAITMKVEPFSGKQWEQVVGALAERPIFMAQLLAGEMPQDIEEVFAAVGLSLFPAAATDLEMTCSCPDWAVVCKHLAAVHYLLAERFDDDPFLIFQLRGKSQEELLGALGRHGAVGAADEGPVADYAPGPPLTESLAVSPAAFWVPGPDLAQFNTRIVPPEMPYPVLTRLGAPAFMEDIQRRLGPAYDAISQRAVQAAFADSTLEDGVEESDAVEQTDSVEVDA